MLLGAVVLGAAPTAQQPPASPPAAGTQEAQPARTPVQPVPPVTFRTEIDYVEVDAVVTDEAGNLVKGLTRDDFEIYEDGVQQKIAMFTQVEIPVERTERLMIDSRPVIPDVKSNARPFDGRLYVIVLDDLHTAALRSALVKRAAREFIDRYLGENDIAAVIHTSGRTDASQEFTNDPRLLNAAIEKFMGQKLRSRTLERRDEYERQRSIEVPQSSDDNNNSSQTTQKIRDPLDFERGYKARNTLGTLRSLADFLAGVRGRRKAVLFFSEGIDYPIYDVFDSHDATTIVQETRDAITAAARANVNFYTIDPRGLHSMGDEIMDMPAPPEDPSLRLNEQGLQDERRLSADSLRTLAEQTGGFAAVETNDFDGAFTRIVNENSTYYVLGYYPPSNKRDGRFHKIEVRVKRPGLSVKARRGYAAPKGKPEKTDVDPTAGTSPALRELLNSPLQTSGLTLNVQAAAFSGTKDNVAVTVEVVGRNLKFQEKGGLYQNEIEVSLLPLEARGKAQQGKRSEVKLNLRPQTAQIMQATAVRLLPRLSLPPGRYQLRVAAREAGGGLTGSVFYDLQVPDFTKEKFVMSGVVLTAATAQVTPTAEADPILKDLLPGPPTTRREFYDIDTIAAYVEVYDRIGGNVPHAVDLTARILAEDGREVAATTEERNSKELSGQKGAGYGFSPRFPLKEIPPGRYVLQIEAKARTRDAETVRREVPFTVLATPDSVRRGAERE
ncbi:MAG TPA: VWA domain-containing protein [Vicinamibacterales bacterium]